MSYILKPHEITFAQTNADDESKWGDDKLFAIRCIRHDKKGYRVSRYVLTINDDWVWDEEYMFYTTLDQVMVAFETKEYSKGRKDF